LAKELAARLESLGFRAEHLDGENIRRLFPATGFSRAEVNLHIERVGYLASKLERNGVFVVASFISPHAESRDIVLEGYQEHHVADVLVKELHQLARDNERWGAKFKVLKESLEHHIEEEESHMFPSARQVLTREELQSLGARMRTMKQDAEKSSRLNHRKR